MKQHILLGKAYCYPGPGKAWIPENHTFIQKNGYWRSNSAGEIMMLSNGPRHPQTKKVDTETEEDQRGE